MSKLPIYDMTGKSQGEMDISSDILVLDKGDQALQDVVVAHRAALRGGNASTLRKGEVAGSNKKPWRQKGTGNARAGYRQSPLWRGGGVAFGPHPRSYKKKVPQKVRRLAFRRALSERISEGSIKVLDKLELAEAKTKSLITLLKSLDVSGSVLIVLDKTDKNMILAARNIQGVDVATAKDVDTYQIVRRPAIVASKEAMNHLRERLELRS